MTAAGLSPLSARLQDPSRRIGLGDLAREWFHQVVRVTLPGHAAVAEDLSLINRIRGAWGHELMRTASREAIADRPCPWNPPCALDVFFREQARFGKHGLPKPFVLALDRSGTDLVVSLTVFGFATDWILSARDALVVALRERIDWRRHYRDLFLPSDPPLDSQIHTMAAMPGPTGVTGLTIQFLTPMDSAGDDPLDRPASFVGRLARRVDGLARWQDTAIEADWKVCAATWDALEYDADDLHIVAMQRGSRRQGKRIENSGVTGSLRIAGDLGPILPLLVVGQTCHAGRGAVSGYGRYEIVSVEDGVR